MFLIRLRNTDVKECTRAMKKRVRGRSLLGLDRSFNCLRVILALIILSTPSASSSNDGFRLLTNRNLELTTQKYVSFPDKRRYCALINLYANHSAMFQLIISGDIETNPGPVNCDSCQKTVISNQRQLVCENCFSKSHMKCSVKIILNGPKIQTWTCHVCTNRLLPFHNVSIEETIIEERSHDQTDESFQVPHQNNTSIAHLNARSICSSFPEFQLFVETYKFDFMTTSETWLKDDNKMIDYVQIPGYQLEYRNRGNRRGDVGVYIKESIKEYKVRKDINRIGVDIEHLWIEVMGKNRNHSYLLGTVYQPNSDIASKEAWLQTLETILSHINNIWDGPVIICGDTKIDTLSECSVRQQYIDLLNVFNMTNVVTKPTRHGKSLIDHLIANIPGKFTLTHAIPCDTVSDHDCPFMNINIKTIKFQPRQKFIRDFKSFNLSDFKSDFAVAI